jgi:hypothetical protein
VLFAAVPVPPAPQTVMLLLDAAHRGLTCVVVAGASEPAHLEGMGDLVVALAGENHPPGAVVFGTVRPDRGLLPSAADERCFAELRHRLGDVGVELIDWFLLAEGHASSLAELSGACWRWHAPEPL